MNDTIVDKAEPNYHEISNEIVLKSSFGISNIEYSEKMIQEIVDRYSEQYKNIGMEFYSNLCADISAKLHFTPAFKPLVQMVYDYSNKKIHQQEREKVIKSEKFNLELEIMKSQLLINVNQLKDYRLTRTIAISGATISVLLLIFEIVKWLGK